METIWNRGRGCSPERRPFAREPRIDRGRSAAPRPRFEAPRDGAQTPPPPTATPYGDTSPSKRIVAATVFVLGSTRVTLWLRRFVTQTPPAPVATLSGPSPTRIRARIRRVSASMRTSGAASSKRPRPSRTRSRCQVGLRTPRWTPPRSTRDGSSRRCCEGVIRDR